MRSLVILSLHIQLGLMGYSLAFTHAKFNHFIDLLVSNNVNAKCVLNAIKYQL